MQKSNYTSEEYAALAHEMMKLKREIEWKNQYIKNLEYKIRQLEHEEEEMPWDR